MHKIGGLGRGSTHDRKECKIWSVFFHLLLKNFPVNEMIVIKPRLMPGRWHTEQAEKKIRVYCGDCIIKKFRMTMLKLKNINWELNSYEKSRHILTMSF